LPGQPTSASTDRAPRQPHREDAALQRTRTSDGVEFHFPPLRDAGAALALSAFGVLCVVLPLAAVYALVPPGVPVPYGLLVLALIGGLIAPFMLCGIAFVCLGINMVANSLEVSASPARLVAVRRLCGFAVSRRELPCSGIAAIESDIPARFQNAFSTEAIYRLVARAKTGRGDDVVVAESLRGNALMEQIKREMESACGLR
jgi:hypothetical protein